MPKIILPRVTEFSDGEPAAAEAILGAPFAVGQIRVGAVNKLEVAIRGRDKARFELRLERLR